MPKFYDYLDLIGLVISFILIIAIGILFKSGAIDSTFAFILVLLIILIPVAKNTIPTILAILQLKVLYGKGTNDYWNEVKKEINRTPNEYNFDYDFKIPETYFPRNTRYLKVLNLLLFELNKDELLDHANEIDANNMNFTTTTILIDTTTSKIKETFRGYTADQTIHYIRNNREFYQESTSQVIIPQKISEITFGQGIQVPTQPKETRERKQ